MNVIDASWDTRSLGVKSGQVVFSDSDSLSQIKEALRLSESYDYVVAKLPVSCVEVIPLLEIHGFSFAECSIEVVLRIRDAKPSILMQRMANQMEVKEADDEQKLEIYKQIETGIFQTDRVALDPLFGPQYAARRYVNWIEDELQNGAILYYVTYKGDGVGFFSYKETIAGKEAWPFLAGVFKSYKRSGIGSNVALDASRIVAQQRGCTRIRTYVSSNNPPILRAQIAYGYQVEKMEYVLTRHSMKPRWDCALSASAMTTND